MDLHKFLAWPEKCVFHAVVQALIDVPFGDLASQCGKITSTVSCLLLYYKLIITEYFKLTYILLKGGVLYKEEWRKETKQSRSKSQS